MKIDKTKEKTLLKVLLAKTDDKKRLDEKEFKELNSQVSEFFDKERGGLTKDAYDAFKDNEQIVAAAKEHQKRWKERGALGTKADQKDPHKRGDKPTGSVGNELEEDVYTFLVAVTDKSKRLEKDVYSKLKEKVGKYMDKESGGLNEEGWEKFKGNKKIAEVAKEARKAKGTKPKEEVQR